MDSLPDPLDDRQMKDIVPPPHMPISDDLLYPNKGMRIFLKASSSKQFNFIYSV